MEVAAFWIAVAAVLIASGWYKSKTEAQKHQTFRTIVEKTGSVDEAQIKLLFNPPSAWHPNALREPVRGAGYRTLRVGGTILMFVGGAGLLFGGVLLLGIIFGPAPAQGRGDGVGIFMALGFAAFMLGAGLFFSSRFCEKPPAHNERPGAGSHT